VADWLALTTEEFSADHIAVLPVAAVEQHGPHLPVGVDTYIAEAYLARVRALLPEESPAVFLPVQAVGASDEHKAFRGTLTLSPERHCAPSSKSARASRAPAFASSSSSTATVAISR
jgi:creatinine amidohydrolase